MIKRLAMICSLAVFLVCVNSLPVWGQATANHVATLKGINTVFVLVGDLPESARKLGLTKEPIQNDVELKLRLAGIRVISLEESLRLPGAPVLFIIVSLTDDAKAAHIDVQLGQDVLLKRNGQSVVAVGTWGTGVISSNPTAYSIRGVVKDRVDTFLNDWLSVNPKN